MIRNQILKLQLKMIQNQYFSNYITSQCLKLSPYFCPIHNGKLIIKFSNLSGTVEHGTALYVTSVNINKFFRLAGYRT